MSKQAVAVEVSNEVINTMEVPVDSRKQFTGDIPVEDKISGIVSAIGSSISLVSDRSVEFSHEMCCKHLELAEFVGERNLDNNHVSVLMACMQSGTFHPEWVTLISAVCEEDSKEYRINGQHTNWARLGMPKDWKEAGKVRYQRYNCKTLDDVRILYSSTDRGKVRNRAMVMNSYLAGTEDFQGISKTILGKLSSGITFWIWEGQADREKRSPDKVSGLMRTEYLALSQSVGAFLSKCWSKRMGRFLLRGPVVAAIYATFDKSAKAASEFWGSVSEGTGFSSPNDPRLRIRNYLMTSVLNMKGAVAKVVLSEEMYRCCIHAFNAWRKGEELSILRAPLGSKRPQPK